METIIDTGKSSLTLHKHKSDKLVAYCVNEIHDLLLEKPTINIFGKECHQQRDVGFFSNESIGYRYSGQIMEAQPLLPYISQLLEKVCIMTGKPFNAILINRYENGSNFISAHSDNMKDLAHSTIACISSGERTFRVRNKLTKEIECDIETINRIMIVMDGEFQNEFTHEIPRSNMHCQRRYSFTFRCHSE